MGLIDFLIETFLFITSLYDVYILTFTPFWRTLILEYNKDIPIYFMIACVFNLINSVSYAYLSYHAIHREPGIDKYFFFVYISLGCCSINSFLSQSSGFLEFDLEWNIIILTFSSYIVFGIYLTVYLIKMYLSKTNNITLKEYKKSLIK